MQTLRRELHPQVRVLNSKGLVEYVASDETLDSYREVIRAVGWRFTYFGKNSPFVDSHDYGTFAKVTGKVVDFHVDPEKRQLINRVQWALGCGNELAELGWRMTEAGYLKAVSVGFWPVRSVSRLDSDRTEYERQLADLGLEDLPDSKKPRTIYLEQEQIELSAVVIGANSNALIKSLAAGVIDRRDFAFLKTGKRSQSFQIPFDPKPKSATTEVRTRLRAALERIEGDAYVAELEKLANNL